MTPRRLFTLVCHSLPIVVVGCAAPPATVPPQPATSLSQTDQPTLPTNGDVDDPQMAALNQRIEQLRQQFEATPSADVPSEIDPTPVSVTDLPPQRDASLTVVSDIRPLPVVAAEPKAARLSEPADAFAELVPEPKAEVTPRGPTDAVLARLKTQPSSAVASFDHELLKLVAGDTAGEMTFPGLRPSEERMVAMVASYLGEFRRELAASPDAEDRVEPILEAAEALRSEVGLRLPTAELCSEVRLWGDYDAIEGRFVAGKPHRAVLYVEADGFKSEQQSDGRWLTRLSLSAVLYDDEGRPVMSLPPKNAQDQSRRRRRDFFLSGLLTLPPHALPGKHMLKVTVRDELAGRVAQQSVPITFIGG